MRLPIAPRRLRPARSRPVRTPWKAACWRASTPALLAFAILAGALSGTAASAQTESPSQPAEIRFTFENPHLHPIRYSLRIAEDGSGEYTSEAGGPLPGDGNDSIIAPGQSRPIRVGEALQTKLFLLARRNKLFAFPCQAAGRIAFSGTKTLSYRGPAGQGSCTYVWSKSKDIQQLTDIFEGIALTLTEGGRLALEHAHTPLALDAELTMLIGMAHQGEALELQNIAPVLTAIADDGTVLKRDQRWARELLAASKAN